MVSVGFALTNYQRIYFINLVVVIGTVNMCKSGEKAYYY